MNARNAVRPIRRVAALCLIALAGLAAWAGAIAGAPAFASGETSEGGGSPTGSPSSPTGASSCPSPNPPNQIALVAGTPQTTTIDATFAAGLQVELTNSDGCAVTGAAGVPVTFSAPAGGASGRFATTDSNTATVGADAAGTAAAPAFTADGTAGSFTVTASSPYGSVTFSLTSTAAGLPARLVAVAPKHGSTRVGSRFPHPLQVRVLDANGNPVAGASVAFALGTGSAGRCGPSTAASATFAGGGAQATATSGAHGIATSPTLMASAAAGSFTATASISGGSGGGGGGGGGGQAESAGNAGAPGVAPVVFSLANRAGRPAKLAPGVGATQSAPAGSAFPIRLAVTVTDADRNPVAGALVTFTAPTAGAGGLFTVRSADSHHHRARVARVRTVKVRTGACGIAVAPPFAASAQLGGYVVEASARPARPAAFALVNEAPGQSL